MVVLQTKYDICERCLLVQCTFEWRTLIKYCLSLLPKYRGYESWCRQCILENTLVFFKLHVLFLRKIQQWTKPFEEMALNQLLGFCCSFIINSSTYNVRVNSCHLWFFFIKVFLRYKNNSVCFFFDILFLC